MHGARVLLLWRQYKIHEFLRTTSTKITLGLIWMDGWAGGDVLQLIYETGSLETPGCIIQTTWLKNRVICIRTEVVQFFSK